MNARLALVGGTDRNPHPSVQAWSRGEFFPAVIKRVETRRYFPTYVGTKVREYHVDTPSFVVLYKGRESEPYSAYDDAHAVACELASGRLDSRLDEVFA